MENSAPIEPPSSASDDPVAAGYATRRWVGIVAAVTESTEDLPTLIDWGHALEKSVGTVKRWCHLCGVHAGDSLDLGRALRVVTRHSGRPCRWYEDLAIAEPATMRRFLSRAGLADDRAVPDLETFLRQQQFVADRALLRSLHDRLTRPA